MSFYSPITNNNPEPNNRQVLTILGIFIGLIILIFWLIGLFINGLINWLPVSVEQQLGAIILPSYQAQAQPSPQQNKLNELLDGLEGKLPQKQQENRDFMVLYIPESTINALAIPGDTIVIYQGLLKEVESENELMMILSHELGHFANRDHLRSLGNVLLIKIAISSLVGDLGNLQSAVDFVNAIANARFSQQQETQADEFGLNLLNQYYGHVAGATDFFQRLSNKNNLDIAFLSTHPSPEKRVKQLEQLIKQENYLIESKKPLTGDLKIN
ncbi:MAG: M48 family metallopeptidase [Gomphosphaeria aponina SAG 52.96 = DSM 107014]|uniref:M48 family metallopeptidase n=1 Tax=Gomphosphaeria aponina SAG 52.96 = DSM 107014 TaxID=1521640 RepID=A0A941JQ01_9CHRO|nr:M48 family metallopeptidase [Gomphosphaeria aponina SAG 52.96 = DSM 107014]